MRIIRLNIKYTKRFTKTNLHCYPLGFRMPAGQLARLFRAHLFTGVNCVKMSLFTLHCNYGLMSTHFNATSCGGVVPFFGLNLVTRCSGTHPQCLLFVCSLCHFAAFFFSLPLFKMWWSIFFFVLFRLPTTLGNFNVSTAAAATKLCALFYYSLFIYIFLL